MTTLGIAVLSCALILLCTGERAPIPPHVLEKLKSLNSLSNIDNIGLTIVPIMRHQTTGRSGEPSSSSEMHEVVDVITNPTQARNSCEIREICVPVPVDDNNDASIFIFPQCIELPRCLGACCDSFQSCHARSVVPVKVAVRKFYYTGTGEMHEVRHPLVEMEKHMECSCEEV